MNLDKKQKTRLAIALGAVVVLVLGLSVLNKSDSASNVSANAAMRGGPPGAPGAPGAPGGRGQMEAVTGTAATKAKAAAEAEVDGTAQQVMKNPRGAGYVVFVQTDDDTPTIVEVSASFKVTATREMQGPPGGAQGGPPQDGQQGTQPQPMQGTNTQ